MSDSKASTNAVTNFQQQAVLQAIRTRYQHLIKTPWDRNFFAEANYVIWFDGQMRVDPIKPDQPLVDYVRSRVTAMQTQKAKPASPAVSATSNGTPATGSAQGTTSAAPTAAQAEFAKSATPPAAATPIPAPKPAQQAPTTQPQAVEARSSEADAIPRQEEAPPASSQQTDDMSNYFEMDRYPTTEPLATSAVQPAQASTSQSGMSDFRETHAGPYSMYVQAPPQTAPRTMVYSASTAYLDSPHHPHSALSQSSQAASIDPSLVRGTIDPYAYSQDAAAAAIPSTHINPAHLTGAGPSQPGQAQKNAAAPAQPIASTSKAVAPPPPTKGGERARWDATLQDVLNVIRDETFSKRPHFVSDKLPPLLARFATPPVDQSLMSSPWGDDSDVPPEGRVLVLRAMIKHGTDEFWSLWYKKADGMDTLMRWFAGAARGKKDEKVSKEDRKFIDTSLVLLLQVFVRLPFAVGDLSTLYKVGARMKRLAEQSKNAEVKTLAKQLVQHWSTLQTKGSATNTPAIAAASSKGKADLASTTKRKAGASAEGGPAGKKAKPASTPAAVATTTTPAAARAKPTVPASTTPAAAATAAAVKPTAPSVNLGAMRSFKKASGTAGPSAGVATDPFSSILESLDKKKPQAPSGDPSKAVFGAGIGAAAAGAKKTKEKKSVRWVEDDKLVAIRFFEKDSDGTEGATELVHDVKMMDEQEGVTLAMHLEQEMEEDIEWYENIPLVELPESEDFASFREGGVIKTPAVEAEDKRLADVVHPTPDDAPTPGSPLPSSISDDFKTATMMLSKELKEDPDVQTAIVRAQATPSPAYGLNAVAVPNEQLSQLLSQLNGGQHGGVAPVPSSSTSGRVVLPPGMSALTEAAASAGPGPLDHDKLNRLAAQLDPNAIASLSQQLNLPASNMTGHNLGAALLGLQQQQQQQQQGWPGYAQPTLFGGAIPPPPPLLPGMSSASGVKRPGQGQAGAGGGGGKQQGKKAKRVCKFFNAPGGCDRGIKCQHIHDRGNGVDVRD